MAPKVKGDEVLDNLSKLQFPDSVKELIQIARQNYADELQAANDAVSDYMRKSSRTERKSAKQESELRILQQRLADAEEAIKVQEDSQAEAADKREAERLKAELRRVHGLVNNKESDLHAAEDRVVEMREYSERQGGLIATLRERAAASKSDSKNKQKIITQLEEEMGNLKRELETLGNRKVVLQKKRLDSSVGAKAEEEPTDEVTELLRVLEDRHVVLQQQVRGLFTLFEGEYAMRRVYERLAKFAVKPRLAICAAPSSTNSSTPGRTLSIVQGSLEQELLEGTGDENFEYGEVEPMDVTRFGEPLSPYPPPPPEELKKPRVDSEKRPLRKAVGYRTKTTKRFSPGEKKRKRGAEKNPLEELEHIQSKLAVLTLAHPPSSRSLQNWVQNERGVCQVGARKRRHLNPLPRRPGDEYAYSMQNLNDFLSHVHNIRAKKEPVPPTPGLPPPGLDREAVVQHDLAPQVHKKAAIKSPLYLNLPPPPPPQWKALPFSVGRKFQVTHQEWCMACASQLQHELDILEPSPRDTVQEYEPEMSFARRPAVPAPRPSKACPTKPLWKYLALVLLLGLVLWRTTRVDSKSWLEANDLPPTLMQRIQMRRESQNQLLRILDFEMSQRAAADWPIMG
ncbi:hypothetical protein P168DRAFT_288139 [Aspergillus campestris IBT 28561]|uniref:Uncharacterized protein n=1 Tax=Aspergillus campestris (strain IBT 28561) TaxID=1392248 RepID=A0A2I1D8J2_ASPC2|nr:uncharacterized protein P168DRAFT_288139 [Aspergillus campestris IBT 28561]PKY06178.1 hypothetical protein P168DRAFT_288139 [Aspergillus campestris IBT 28561]